MSALGRTLAVCLVVVLLASAGSSLAPGVVQAGSNGSQDDVSEEDLGFDVTFEGGVEEISGIVGQVDGAEGDDESEGGGGDDEDDDESEGGADDDDDEGGEDDEDDGDDDDDEGDDDEDDESDDEDDGADEGNGVEDIVESTLDDIADLDENEEDDDAREDGDVSRGGDESRGQGSGGSQGGAEAAPSTSGREDGGGTPASNGPPTEDRSGGSTDDRADEDGADPRDFERADSSAESNDDASEQVDTPGPPELRVESVSANRSTVDQGEPVRITVAVHNVGESAVTREVRLRLFDEVVDTRSVTVPANDSRRLSFVRRIESPGRYEASVDDVGTTITVAGDVESTPQELPPQETPGFTVPAALAALVGVLVTALLAQRRT